MKAKILLLSMAAISMAACTNDVDPDPQPRLKTVTATLPQTTGTRVGMEYDQADDVMKVTWSESEAITINWHRYNGTGADDGLTATFEVPEDINAGSVITYGSHRSTQTQTATDNYDHLAGVHYMTGKYNEDNNTIDFTHDVSVLHIALSGLREGEELKKLTVGGYTLNLAGLSTTAEGTFTAWLSMLGGADIENLRFVIEYTDGTQPQEYIHPFAAEATLPSGELLYCKINMEQKVGFVTDPETGAIWGVPQYVVPGYDYVVYDEASFLAMPVRFATKTIQIADITLNTAISSEYQGGYNGNGYTITGNIEYVFSSLENGIIVNLHLRGNMGLARETNNAIISHCSVVGRTMVNNSSDYDFFTMCSTDQATLVSSGSPYFAACWYNGAPQSTDISDSGYIWYTTRHALVWVPIADLLNPDGTINWDYKYVEPEYKPVPKL